MGTASSDGSTCVIGPVFLDVVMSGLAGPRAQVKNNGYQDAPSLQVEQQTRPSLLRVYFRRLTQTIPPVHAWSPLSARIEQVIWWPTS